MSAKMLEEAVLDEATTGALLRLARDEGLLHENRMRTDAFIDAHSPKRLPLWLRDQLFEQIILTPKLTTLRTLPREGLSGELLESGILTPSEKPTVDSALVRVPAEMVIGALHARGEKLTWAEVQSRFENAWLADTEAQKFRLEYGRPLPDGFLRMLASMRAFMDGRGFDNNEPPEGYTRDDVLMAHRHDEAFSAASPILRVIDELVHLFAYSSQPNVLLRPAILPTRGRTIAVAEGYREGIRAGALFRLVARRLDVPTHGATLRSTLALARDPAAASLRYNLPLWLTELAAGNIKPATLIEREIQRANAALERRANRARVGRVIGYFTVPLDVVEFLLNMPPLANLSVQYVAEVIKRKANDKATGVEWIHFGSRRA